MNFFLQLFTVVFAKVLANKIISLITFIIIVFAVYCYFFNNDIFSDIAKYFNSSDDLLKSSIPFIKK